MPQRSDGVKVRLIDRNSIPSMQRWFVIAADDTRILTCPCCGASFRSMQQAKQCADSLYPIGGKLCPSK